MEDPKCHIHREYRMGTIPCWGDGKGTYSKVQLENKGILER